MYDKMYTKNVHIQYIYLQYIRKKPDHYRDGSVLLLALSGWRQIIFCIHLQMWICHMRIHDALIISEKGEQSLKMIFCYLESFVSILNINKSCEVCLWYFVVVNHATIVGNLKEISTYVLRSTHCREFLKVGMTSWKFFLK